MKRKRMTTRSKTVPTVVNPSKKMNNRKMKNLTTKWNPL